MYQVADPLHMAMTKWIWVYEHSGKRIYCEVHHFLSIYELCVGENQVHMFFENLAVVGCVTSSVAHRRRKMHRQFGGKRPWRREVAGTTVPVPAGEAGTERQSMKIV